MLRAMAAENAARPHEPGGAGGLGARLRSFRYAFRGIARLVADQPNARIHACATVVVVGLGFLLRVSALEWAALVLAIAAVWSAEALNTAIEDLADATRPEFHPLVERSKDIAAAGVLLAAIGATVVGLLVLGPPLWRWLA